MFNDVSGIGPQPAERRSISASGVCAGCARIGWPVQRLDRRQNMPVCSTFCGRLAADLPCGISAGGRREAGGRPRQDRQPKDPDLQDVFYGSDGTRTRDLRRDRPVVALPAERGLAGIPDVSRAFRLCRCGDLRVAPGASGGLLRDQRGMRRCLAHQRGGVSAGYAPLPSRAQRIGRVAPRWRWFARSGRQRSQPCFVSCWR